jgi:hypothetical protein
LAEVPQFVDTQEQVRPDDQQRQAKQRRGSERRSHAARPAAPRSRRTHPTDGGAGTEAGRSEHGGEFLAASEPHRGRCSAEKNARQWAAPDGRESVSGGPDRETTAHSSLADGMTMDRHVAPYSPVGGKSFARLGTGFRKSSGLLR